MITTLTLPKWMASSYATIPSHHYIAERASNWSEDVMAVYYGASITINPTSPPCDEINATERSEPQPHHNDKHDVASTATSREDEQRATTTNYGRGQSHGAHEKNAEAIYRENAMTIAFLITKQIIDLGKNFQIGSGSGGSSDGSAASGNESAMADSCCIIDEKMSVDGSFRSKNDSNSGCFSVSSGAGIDNFDSIINMDLTTVTLEISNQRSNCARGSNHSNSSARKGSRIRIRSVNAVLNNASFKSQPQQERAFFYAIGDTLFKLFGRQESISIGCLINDNMDAKGTCRDSTITDTETAVKESSSKKDQKSESSDDEELFENNMMDALTILDEESAAPESRKRNNATSCQASLPIVIDLVSRATPPNSATTVASPFSCNPSVATKASPALLDDEPIGTNQQQHPTKNKNSTNNPTHYTFSQVKNQYPTFPIPVVRLISDLIDSSDGAREYKKSTTETFSRSRSRRRKSLFTSLPDVLEDFKQMVLEPSIFLHESQSISANGKLDFGTNLHGRQEDISRILQVAKTVSNRQVNTDGLLEIISIEGYSGSGKTALVRRVGQYLSITKGWFFLQGKFDRMRQNDSLSVVTSALENYCLNIQFMKTKGGAHDLEYCSKVSDAVMKALGHEGIAYLSRLIPSLRHMVEKSSHSKEQSSTGSMGGMSLSSLASDSITIQTTSDALMPERRLEYLLIVFLESILSLDRPILLFYDNMQWAEVAALQFLSKLLEHVAGHSEARKNLLYIQVFRDNEITSTDPLHTVMSPAVSHKSTSFSQIKLEGFDTKALNDVLSIILRLPRRITYPLSGIVHRKTMGNFMFVVEFMKELQGPCKKMLYYSCTKHRWRWDADSIELKSISSNVAGLLMNKLLCLEKNALNCLIIASCFGAQVNASAIQNLEGIRGTANMIDNLESMVEEGLLEKAGPLFMFVHDAIQQTVYELSPENDRVQLHIEIGSMLISKVSETPVEGLDEVFVQAVDHINLVLKYSEYIPMMFTPSQRVSFAKLNLRACQKDIKNKSDFTSAKVYLNAAMSFLPENCWAFHYDLTLQIYDEYTNVLLVKREFEQIFVHTDVILKKAKCLEDQMQAHEALISALFVSGSTSKSVGHARMVIEALGFPFPAYVEEETISNIMNTLGKQSEGFTQDHVSLFPVMEDPVTLQAMRIMSIVMFPCSLVDPTMFLLMACQMMQLTIVHGLCADSALAFAYFGYAQTSQNRNYDDGYRMGKLAIAILDRFNARDRIVSVSFIVYGFMSVWKEPFQTTIKQLEYSIDTGFKQRDQDNALLNSVVCGRQEILAGKNLLTLSEKLERICRAMMYDKSKNKYFVSFNPMLGDIYLIASLTGESNERLSSIFISHSENEKILLERSRAAYGTATSQLVNYHQCCKAFWFRDYTTVMKCCETYDNIHQTSRKRLIRITDICNSFYGGLAMFILSRKFKEQKLIADGETHLLAMKIWETTCKWNFENKSMLLEAECHYAKGDNANAMVAYAKSIASARDHNFIHEEALAEELFGIFYIENGELRKGSELIKHARDLYIQWGAHKKASLLYYPSSI